jgi:2-methylcitrate dehydratase
VFEGRKGFFKLISTPADIDVGAFGGRGVPFRIHQCGMKAYPAVVYSQTAIAAGVAVAREIGDVAKVAAIEVATTKRGYEQAGRDAEKWAPQNRDTADHSLPYITARAMLDGGIDNRSYAPDKLRDPRVAALMRKITVREDPDFARPKGNAPATRLTVTLDTGARITREVNDMPGFAGQPMSRADVERKFRGNVGDRWPKERTDATLRDLWRLEEAADLSSLLATLAA